MKLDVIYNEDCLAGLKKLPACSVHCVVTSPPYFGLRDYGVDGQIGLESTPDAYVQKIVAVFREVRRVLRDDGTVWLNLGDSYCSTAPATWGDPLRQDGIFSGVQDNTAQARRKFRPATPDGLKPKDLIGIPWRVAFALQADGWYLRSDIIWHKPNPMPESVRDRPTKSHEYLFLLAKSERYYYAADAIKEPAGRAKRSGPNSRCNIDRDPAHLRYGSGNLERRLANGTDSRLNTHLGFGVPWEDNGTGRNRRSVWTLPTKPYKGAHFATFPETLVEPCILAGSPEGGTVCDIFMGAGTVALVAQRTNRHYIGFELNAEYIRLAEARIAKGRMDRKERNRQVAFLAPAA